jgi:hypothetical protein
VVEKVALEQVCVGESGAGTGLCWRKWRWNRFVVEKVALERVCVGESDAGTGFPPNISAFPVNISALMFLSHSFINHRQYATLAVTASSDNGRLSVSN